MHRVLFFITLYDGIQISLSCYPQSGQQAHIVHFVALFSKTFRGRFGRETVRNSILKIKVPGKEAKETAKEVRGLHIFADEDHAHMQKPGKAKGKKNQVVPVVKVAEGIYAI